GQYARSVARTSSALNRFDEYGCRAASHADALCRAGTTASSLRSNELWLAGERGLEDRSRKPSTPSAQKRPTHLPSVFGVVLNWRAAVALDMPRSTTARTISSRPFGVRRAFL